MMNTRIINLTEPFVAEEIEKILETYPFHPYQQVFAHPELRQKLMAHVLSRIPNQYAVVKIPESCHIAMEKIHASIALQLDVKAAIHQGIRQLFELNADWAVGHIPSPDEPSYAASSWFG